VLGPLGAALAGPLAAAFGVRETLLGAAVVMSVCFGIVLAQPSVWAVRPGGPAVEPVPA